MDVQILINKLNEYKETKNIFSYFFSLRAEVPSESWNNLIITNSNSVLRDIESQLVSVVFVCSNDLKHSVHIAHIPFLCRLYRTKLVVLKSGSAKDLNSYFGKNDLFMFAIRKNSDSGNIFASQFPDIEPINPNQLPPVSIKK
jgi:hypothetical protein